MPHERLASPEAVARGGELFRTQCAICHGAGGHGDGPQQFGLDPKPRDLTLPAWRASTSPAEVFVVIRDGVPATAMPGWRSLSEEQRWDLTAFVLSLSER